MIKRQITTVALLFVVILILTVIRAYYINKTEDWQRQRDTILSEAHQTEVENVSLRQSYLEITSLGHIDSAARALGLAETPDRQYVYFPAYR